MTATVKKIVENRPVHTIEKTATVQEAAERMANLNVGALPVMDGSRLVGILSERDVINRVVAKTLEPRTTRVSEVMTTNLAIARADESYEACLKKMKLANCRHLPVIEGDVLLGLLSIRDLMQIELSDKDDHIQFLHDYMFHVPPPASGKYSK